MTDPLAPIAEKLRPLIRLLASDQSGEVVAAARALDRLLKRNGADLHTLADSIGRANGSLNKEEMKRLYDAGFEAGAKAVEDRQQFDNDGFREAIKLPGQHEMARWCQTRRPQLNEWERGFINSVASKSVYRELTEREDKCLRKIFCRLGGGD